MFNIDRFCVLHGFCSEGVHTKALLRKMELPGSCQIELHQGYDLVSKRINPEFCGFQCGQVGVDKLNRSKLNQLNFERLYSWENGITLQFEVQSI